MIAKDVEKSKEQIMEELADSRSCERALRVSETLYRDLIECASDGLLVLSADKQILSCNRAVLDIFDLNSLDAIQGKSFGALFPSETTYDDFQEIMAPFMEEAGLFDTEWTMSRHEGEAFWAGITLRLASQTPGNGAHYVAGIRDLTLHQGSELQAAFAVTHDVLTGLPNRLLLNDRIELAMLQSRRRQQPFTLLLIDLDDFNHVNTSYGYMAGDALLKASARRIGVMVRNEDTVARLGNDEFAVLLFAAGHKGDAIGIARKVLNAFQEPFEVAGHSIQMTASVGITLFPDESASVDELLRHAGLALQHAKELGRNGYECYTPDLEYEMAGV